MASPQTHGLFTVSILAVFLLLSILGLAGEITLWEYFSAILWGVFIDLEHFFYWSYLKDLPSRIKRGGGMPSKQAQGKKAWLHMWPGLLVVIAFGFFFHLVVASSFRWYFPLIFWAIHVLLDYFQNSPSYSFFYPYHTREELRPPKRSYPVKPPWEFMLSSAIWMIICFVLLGLLIFK